MSYVELQAGPFILPWSSRISSESVVTIAHSNKKSLPLQMDYQNWITAYPIHTNKVEVDES